MQNSFSPGFKSEGPKNILNELFNGVNGFNLLTNTGGGQAIGSTSGQTILLKTLIAGTGINITSNANEITISETAGTNVLPLFYDQNTFLVSQTHPNTDQLGSRVYSTITGAIADLPIGPGTFQILVCPGTYIENPTYTGNLDLYIVGMSNFTLSGTMTFNPQAPATINSFNGSAGIIMVDDIAIGVGATTPINLKLTFVMINNTLTDISATGSKFNIFNCFLNKITVDNIDEIGDTEVSGAVIISNTCDIIHDLNIHCTSININSWKDNNISGFRNCKFTPNAGIFTSVNNLCIDSNSLYSFQLNNWNNASIGLTILEESSIVNPSEISGPSGVVSTLTTQPYTNVIAGLWDKNLGNTRITYDNLNRVSKISQQRYLTLTTTTPGPIPNIIDYFDDPDFYTPPNLGGSVYLHFLTCRMLVYLPSTLNNAYGLQWSFIINQSSSNVITMQQNSYSSRAINPSGGNPLIEQVPVIIPPYFVWNILNDFTLANPYKTGKFVVYIDDNTALHPTYDAVIQVEKLIVYQ